MNAAPRWIVVLGLLLSLLVPVLASAQIYQAYINNPAAALRSLRDEAEQLERRLAELETEAAAMEAETRLHRDRAVKAIRFYDSLLFGFALQAVFGAGDLVDLLSQLHLLEILAGQEADRLRALSEQHLEVQRTQAELVRQRAALENRRRLLEAFEEAYRRRQELMSAYRDPLLRDLNLALAWHEDAPMAIRLLQHLQTHLRDGTQLFRRAGPVFPAGTYMTTQEAVAQRVLPLPPDVSSEVDSLEIFLLPDHAYWVLRHDGQLTILITHIEPHGRRQLKFRLVQALYRGVPLPAEQIAAANEAAPLIIDISQLEVAAVTVRHDEGRILLGP